MKPVKSPRKPPRQKTGTEKAASRTHGKRTPYEEALKERTPGDTRLLNERAIIAALEEGGAIAKRLDTYELRQSQLGLMRLVIRGFNYDAFVAAEAGTGVGKSFAYLLPALSHVLLNNERIVISTATITLQEQLYEKDIPLVLSALGVDIKVALMKGRGNYLCLRRFDETAREQSFFTDPEYEALQAMSAWIDTTHTGARSDISFPLPDSLWSRVACEADLCMGARCHERERCFFQALRAQAATAPVLVVNHHLLFADASARRDGAGYDGMVVLPLYHRVIIDEAHTVEEAATSFFSEQFSRFSIYRQTARLFRRQRGSLRGLLVLILPALHAKDLLDKIESVNQKIRDSADALDKATLELCKREGVFRLTPDSDKDIRATLVPFIEDLRSRLQTYTALIKSMLDTNTENEENVIVWEIKSIRKRLEFIAQLCRVFIEYKQHPDKVLWLERHNSSGDPWVSFTSTPLNVSLVLKEAIFNPNKTVVCVSATLTVNDTFDYWASRCGLALVDERLVLYDQFPSPFPYATSVLLAIPTDAPLPLSDAPYRDFVNKAVGSLAARAGGSALILFTSYSALESAYNASKALLEKQGIRCLKQGDDDRSRLLKTFLTEETSVLFATDSFWEGIDAPGDTLRLVILCRLPFRTPNEPVFAARCEDLERRGGNSFMELSVPESVMKFKQGFGRLMRRSSDRGVVVVLDARVIRKLYGKVFLSSLPETKVCFAELRTIADKIERFLE
ncbi:MAG: ATP-dependent DNA helicase DinG [Treponema sp.]|nr:ATP-dependent DNA helicase DinG [Treponema sp.]